MKKRIPTIFIAFCFLAGLSLLLYPTVSNQWNLYHQSRAIVSYGEEVSELDEEMKLVMWQAATKYNEELNGRNPHWVLAEEEWREYENQLDVTGTGIMAYLEIPKIDCQLPIYHGTSEGVLAEAVGHIEGSSLPVGGGDTHCVLSGHRGLPSARLLTDLDDMEVGDMFFLHVLGETLTYEVDQIKTVLPYELDQVEIEPGKDLCTLVTCTPYGINSHRLLVRGHRIETVALPHEMTEEKDMSPGVVITLMIVTIDVIILLAVVINKFRKKREKREV